MSRIMFGGKWVSTLTTIFKKLGSSPTWLEKRVQGFQGSRIQGFSAKGTERGPESGTRGEHFWAGKAPLMYGD